jgi:amino acid adenylation domain-containing protein
MSLDLRLQAGTPLTPLQKRIWAQTQVGSLGAHHVQRLGLVLPPATVVTDVERALAALARLHPALSARFHREDGGNMTQTAGPADAVRPVKRRVPAAGLQAELEAALASARFDLERDGGAHVTLLLGDDGALGLGFALHPILADAAALDVLAEDLLALLAGEPVPAPDAILAERKPGEARFAYWRARFAGDHVGASLPRRDGAEESPNGAGRATARAALGRELRARLQRLAADWHCDEATLLAAGFHAVLARYNGQWDLRTGLVIEDRDSRIVARQEELMPLFVSADPAAGLRALLRQIEAARLDGLRHFVASDILVQDRLRRSDSGRNPLAAAVFHYRRALDLPPGVRLTTTPEPVAYGDLALSATPQPDGDLHLIASYPGDLFEPALVARFCTHVVRLLRAVAHTPDLPLRDIALVSPDELDALSAPYPDTGSYDPRPVHEIIAAHAAATPSKTAILCGEAKWSHGALDAGANRLAHLLIAAGVRAETPVAILVERGAEAVMAMLATLKAGGAYVPVEPGHPESRNHHILRDAGVVAVITRGRWRDRLPAGLDAAVIDLDGFLGTGAPATAPEVAIHPDQLAYIMYTSGSTGLPKGVAVEHGPLSRHNQATARVYEMSAASRELPFLPFSSDGGHERWMVPLMEGGSVVIPGGPLWTPEQTLAAMRRHGCNNASIPTTYLQQLSEWAELTGEAPPMRLYSFGGEGLPQATFELLSRALNAETLINGYGPTETIMTPMVWKVRAGTRFAGAYAPLGRAVGLRRAYVLDADMMPCPIGVTGEIHLGGDGVARGYVGRSGTTADRFIPDPFGAPGGRLFRTGDLGRWREDGTIEFVGRTDLQVKLNGYRIEPGEIEAALLAADAVAEALVLLRELDGGKALVAYVVPAIGAELDETALRRGLEARLPPHMLPGAIVGLDKMPTNPNAKLDRAALPLPERHRRRSAGIAPETALERQLAEIWCAVLGLEAIGATDDFFDMGGQSLTALKVLQRLKLARPGCRATIADLFNHPTIRGLAAAIEAELGGRQAIALRAQGTQPRLYCFPGLLVSTREYLRLTDYLGPDQPVTGFLCHSLNERKLLNVSVSDVVADYAAQIRAESAGKPCAFLGWSWGGLLAWEAAQQLQGEIDLRMIGMIDVCDLGSDFAPRALPHFAPGERARLEREVEEWLAQTAMKPQWQALIGAMDALCYDQFLKFIGNEREPLPTDGPDVSSREHTFWVLIDNALVFRQHRPAPLDCPVRSWSAEDSLSRGLNLIDWRRLSPRATPAEIVPGTNHLHIIGDRLFHARFARRLAEAFAEPDRPQTAGARQ